MKKKLIMTFLLACLMSIVAAQQAMAARPSVGTSITNTLTANYTDAASAAMPQESASVAITVLQVYSVSVTPTTDAKNGFNNLHVVYAFTVTNTGNGPDTFDLTSVYKSGWTPTSVTFYSDAGETTSITDTGLLTEGGAKTVYAKVIIPNSVTAPSGTTSVEWFTATSRGDVTQAAHEIATTSVGVAELDTSTKTSDKASYKAGETVIYTVHTKNDGVLGATSVVLTDVIPVGLTYLSASEGSYDGGTKTVTVNVGDLAAGASHDITIRATLNAGLIDQTDITNTANWTYVCGSLSESESASCIIAVDAPKLKAQKTANPTTAKPGDTVEYTVTITNIGHDSATNVTIADVVPTTYLAFGSITGQTGCSASQAGGTVTATPTGGTLAAGAAMTFKFTVTVNTL